MNQNIFILLFIYLSCLTIYLFIKLFNIQTDLNKLKKKNIIPEHSHPTPKIDNSEETIGLTIEDVDNRIHAIAPSYSVTMDGNGNTFRSTTFQELGFEYNSFGDKLIFNKPIDFNNEILFNKHVDFNERINVNNGLEGSSAGRDTSILNIFGDAYVTRDFGNGRNNTVNKNLITIGNDTVIKSYNNMIAPFYVNFKNQDEIDNLRSKNWYLCDGQDITVNGVTRTTPDLRGRFIWGGGNSPSTSLPSMINEYEQEDTSYTNWGDNTVFDGGEGYHILDMNEMPQHNHNVKARKDDVSGSQETGWHLRNTANKDEPWAEESIYQEDRGMGKPHNNLPPYIVLAYFIYWPKTWIAGYEPWLSEI